MVGTEITMIASLDELERIVAQEKRVVLYFTPPRCREVDPKEFELNVLRMARVFRVKTDADSRIPMKLGVGENVLTLQYWEDGKKLVQATSFAEFRVKVEKVVNCNERDGWVEGKHWMRVDDSAYLQEVHDESGRAKAAYDRMTTPTKAERVEDRMDGI